MIVVTIDIAIYDVSIVLQPSLNLEFMVTVISTFVLNLSFRKIELRAAQKLFFS